MIEYNIKEENYDEDEEQIQYDNSIRFNLSLPCNSYDAENPEIEYPENFQLDHDGVFVYLQVTADDGGKQNLCYWED